MRIRLNGAARETRAATIGELIDELDLPRQLALVELNGEAVPRQEWDARKVAEGDSIEVLRVAAGG